MLHVSTFLGLLGRKWAIVLAGAAILVTRCLWSDSKQVMSALTSVINCLIQELEMLKSIIYFSYVFWTIPRDGVFHRMVKQCIKDGITFGIANVWHEFFFPVWGFRFKVWFLITIKIAVAFTSTWHKIKIYNNNVFWGFILLLMFFLFFFNVVVSCSDPNISIVILSPYPLTWLWCLWKPKLLESREQESQISVGCGRGWVGRTNLTARHRAFNYLKPKQYF